MDISRIHEQLSCSVTRGAYDDRLLMTLTPEEIAKVEAAEDRKTGHKVLNAIGATAVEYFPEMAARIFSTNPDSITTKNGEVVLVDSGLYVGARDAYHISNSKENN